MLSLLRILWAVSFSFSAFASSIKPYCTPTQDCWPKTKEWEVFNKKIHNRLIVPKSTLSNCDVPGKQCDKALQNIKNPFHLQSNPGDTETVGWYGAWVNEVSAYAVAAKEPEDVINAVRFANKHNLRISIKGAGHDYLGRNNAKDSLLVWTRPMQKLEYTTDFIPQGAPKGTKPLIAVTVGAGQRWLNVYDLVTTKHHRYAQGGGCTTVGATGGFTQGGGFGSSSKKYGTGAASVLQLKIVTADGKLLVANEYQNSDLFWAIRGGGGGTFGIVTEMTLLTHELPKQFGLVTGEIKADSDISYLALIKQFLTFFNTRLNNEHWGENISFKKDNTISWLLVSQNLSKKEINTIWLDIETYVNNNKSHYTMTRRTRMIPSIHMWDYDYLKKHLPDMVVKNTGPNAQPGEFWWKPNSGEVSAYLYTYQSWWIPVELFSKEKINQTSNSFYNASRLHEVGFHIQKGLAGGSQEAIERTKQTSTHPEVFNAAGLVIMTARNSNIYPNVEDYQVDKKKVEEKIALVSKSMSIIKALAPHAGSYVNEADYFQTDWQHTFYGSNYPRLLKIKRKYDPNSRFTCHHCVGSELGHVKNH